MEVLLDLLRKGEDFLRKKGVENPRLDSELLMCHFLKMSRIDLYLNFNMTLNNEKVNGLRELFKKRGMRVPLQYILNRQEFWGLDFYVDENVLIPRPETEMLVSESLDTIKNYSKKDIKVLDLCTGSGCIAVSIASSIPGTKIYGADISINALKIASRNSEKNNTTVLFFCGDLFSPVKNKPLFDIIVSNPPYIKKDDIPALMPEVKDYEPVSALTAGIDGLDFYRKIIQEAPNYLAPQGKLILEIGSGQYEEIKNIAENVFSKNVKIYDNITLKKDLANHERMVVLERH